METPQELSDLIHSVAANFGRIYLGGIPSLLNDDGAYLSFICCLTATEALGAFLKPNERNGPRFEGFVKAYFPEPYNSQSADLWKLRNAAVHEFSTGGPYALTHHNSPLHLKIVEGKTVLNAEDFYAVLVFASKRYFDDLVKDLPLQAAFLKRATNSKTGVLVVRAVTGRP